MFPGLLWPNQESQPGIRTRHRLLVSPFAQCPRLFHRPSPSYLLRPWTLCPALAAARGVRRGAGAPPLGAEGSAASRGSAVGIPAAFHPRGPGLPRPKWARCPAPRARHSGAASSPLDGEGTPETPFSAPKGGLSALGVGGGWVERGRGFVFQPPLRTSICKPGSVHGHEPRPVELGPSHTVLLVPARHPGCAVLGAARAWSRVLTSDPSACYPHIPRPGAMGSTSKPTGRSGAATAQPPLRLGLAKDQRQLDAWGCFQSLIPKRGLASGSGEAKSLFAEDSFYRSRLHRPQGRSLPLVSLGCPRPRQRA